MLCPAQNLASLQELELMTRRSLDPNFGGRPFHMSCRLFVVVATVLCAACASGQTTGEIPFSSAGIRSLPGKDICSLQGEFPKRFGVYLGGGEQYSVAYRERDGVIALFLLEKSPSTAPNCGIVHAVLDLTNLRRGSEVPEFKCHVNSEGRTRWGHVVGLGDNRAGTERYITPRLAWRVDITGKRFEEIKGQPVTCDTTGYTEGDGWF
jgi:hypothetical protein